MSTNFEWSQFEEVPEQSNSKEFDWSQFEEVEEAPKRFGKQGTLIGGKVGSAIGAAIDKPSLLLKELPTAILKNAEGLAALGDPVSLGLKMASPREDVSPSKMLSNKLREDLPEELQEGAEDIADLESFLMPLPLGGKAAPGAGKLLNKKVPFPKRVPKVPDTFPSGLTKPRAVGAKSPQRGIISPERQQKTIQKLNEEASDLAKKTVEKRLPFAKKIEEGFDFDKQYERSFGEIKSLADRANPEIDITPVSRFLRETSSKYRGIPKLHPDAAKVMSEIRAFSNRPQSSLSNLLKIYRSNNKKITNSYETSRVTGKQQEYVDFLLDMNRKIAESFENTLPADSAWVKQFKDMNSHYSEYKNTLKALNQIEPILNQSLTPSSLKKFAVDKKLQKKLQLSMGKEGSQEIIQIAKDLDAAQSAIKKIPVKEIKAWEKIMPFSILIPGLGKIAGGTLTLLKGAHYARRAYGAFLSNPAKRKAMDQALRAISSHDIKAYETAAQVLLEHQPSQSIPQ